MMRGARSDMNMEDLAGRMSALEEEAFLQFSLLFGPRFRKLFINRGLTVTDAEDLAVSCVTDIALKVGQYRATLGNFEAWVFTLARHYLIDWWRTQHPNTQLIDDLPESSGSDEAIVASPEVISAVRQAMGNLSENDRRIISMKSMGVENTFADVGEQLGISPGTARVRHLRAVKKLEKLLEGDDRIKDFLKRRKVIRKEKIV